ncbi:trimeric intracellular cation channel family protein [Sedimenticola thiotaurini]|uniref:Membrane protein n=1 Tax=Sedimenticola thiotaurini TaxID=1543721 RepID=A0A0F7JWU2_9GAMM|nr:trimeric intracellular cation channel family protein [Sedimenticola thiotaurini]AKH20072.1 membrane protein [Sedimenticola thiotaurini]
MSGLDLGSIIDWTGLFGIAVFAVSGSLEAARKEMDILGFLLIGCVTGLGGGTLRDLLLGATPVYWIERPEMVMICLVASVATYFLAPLLTSRYRALVWMDAIGLSTFCITGTAIAMAHGASPLIAVCMGVMSATFGGIIRDVLCAESLILSSRELYVTTAVAGATAYLLLQLVNVGEMIATLGAFSIAFGLRTAAILFGLKLPQYRRPAG